ncbi:autophagy protein 6 [Myotisia sp. PD_48]|nr:autophagy protein 6 [Myotisia sp. PD_48]
MHCQKCRTALKLDGSLEDLNPAAYDLLVGSTGKSAPDPSTAFAHSHSSYPPERKVRYDQIASRAASPVFKRSIPPSRYGHVTLEAGSRDTGPNMSFVMLNESQLQSSPYKSHGPTPQIRDDRLLGARELPVQSQEKAFSDQVEKTMRIFEIVSARSDIDHPICADCTEMVVDGLQQKLNVATKERDAYISFLKNLNSSIPAEEEIKAAEETLAATLKAEAEAFDQLLALEEEKKAVDRELAELEEESRQLDLEEQQFWYDRNAFALTLSEFQNERDALNVKYDHDSRQLERLQRTNVYNDAFCISHDGFFGTINGLRLGRLANPSVEWSEINAAWGQTALLLATVAERLGFQFQGYKLRPLGSTSRIDKLEYPQQSEQDSLPINGQPIKPKVTQLDLFSSSGDLPLNLPWVHRRFDTGMIALLECLRQLGAHVEKTPTSVSSPSGPPSPLSKPGNPPRRSQTQVTGLKLPYEIKRDKIGDASIKLGFNQNDETWTRACKYTLTCCKFLLAHASNIGSARPSGS